MSTIYDESKAQDLLFLIDGSRSMGGKLKGAGRSKFEIVRAGLSGFVAEKWPISYFPWPLRIGVTFFRLIGTPGRTEIDIVISMNPPPSSLEMYRLKEMPCRGGSPLVDALKYGVSTISESLRKDRKVKVISDGGNDGPRVKTIAEELKAAKVQFDAIELSNSASGELREVASLTGGKYYRPNNMADFNAAIRA
ncbi:MAG: VWA domain-containing protein [Nitrososphaerales archaeon]|nr:VWA domain-containing protein [Nitrososphaerales archaeon]